MFYRKKNVENLRVIKFILLMGLTSLLLGSCGPGKKHITIGTGGITGVYYPVGGAISELVNKKSTDIKANYESTGGSVFNVNAVLNGDMDFGIVQSDRQYQAYKGINEWEAKGAQTNLRAVFSLHTEAVTLVASVDSGINSVESIKGKRVNIGNPGSGQRQNAIDALAASGLTLNDIEKEEVKASEAPGLLQDGRIDAFFYTVGHPSGAIKEATSGVTKVRLVPIFLGEELLANNPFYAKAAIAISHYPQAEAETTERVATFGVKATLVTHRDISDEVVYQLVKAVMENLNEFKKIHPALTNLTTGNMLEGLSAPVHPGALRYYREKGWK